MIVDAEASSRAPSVGERRSRTMPRAPTTQEQAPAACSSLAAISTSIVGASMASRLAPQ